MLYGDLRTSRLAARSMNFLTFVIIASISLTCLSTVEQVENNHTAVYAFWVLQIIFSAVFTVELIMRFAVLFDLEHDVTCYDGLKALAKDPLTWVDVVALLPFYARAVLVNTSGGAEGKEDLLGYLLEACQLLRLLRLFTLARHFEGAIILKKALKHSAPALVVPLYFLVTSVVVFAGLFYVIENLIYNNHLFKNVFISGWFVLVSMTTVGYGDMYPQSAVGKVLACVSIMTGVLFMAMPITIVGSAFARAWDEMHNDEEWESLVSHRHPDGRSARDGALTPRASSQRRSYDRLDASIRSSMRQPPISLQPNSLRESGAISVHSHREGAALSFPRQSYAGAPPGGTLMGGLRNRTCRVSATEHDDPATPHGHTRSASAGGPLVVRSSCEPNLPQPPSDPSATDHASPAAASPAALRPEARHGHEARLAALEGAVSEVQTTTREIKDALSRIESQLERLGKPPP